MGMTVALLAAFGFGALFGFLAAAVIFLDGGDDR